MAELIHMRQRIKTVETIKKITHAMRLVSMSAHAKLGKQFAAIKTYHASISAILNQVNALAALNNHKTESPGPQRTLLIAVGSQKGLSGSFNSVLFYELSAYLSRQNRFVQIISVGKKMVDLVSSTYKNRNIVSFPNLSATQAPAIAQTITERIIANQNNFTSVMILSMVPKNFFIQMARTTPLLPLQLDHETPAPISHDYLWESDPAQLMEQLTKQYITSTIYKALLESLVAEQAARFVSMDSATRNAEKILEATKLKYNKLRQAKITKELLELADTF
jgi:F-type H+-transporting ATPase subunit gamma